MIKTLSQALRMDKERFKVPKSVQQAIPIQRIWLDGIFNRERNSQKHIVLQISTIILRVRTIRQKCFWIIPNS